MKIKDVTRSEELVADRYSNMDLAFALNEAQRLALSLQVDKEGIHALAWRLRVVPGIIARALRGALMSAPVAAWLVMGGCGLPAPVFPE